MKNRGLALTRLGRHDEAEELLREGYDIFAPMIGATHKVTIGFAQALIEGYVARGDHAKAAEWRAKLPASTPDGSESEASSDAKGLDDSTDDSQ